MDARSRVRAYLSGKGAAPPPLVPFATGFAARLEQVPPETLRWDANALTRVLVGLQTLFGFDAVVLEIEPAAVAGRRELRVEREALRRTRALLVDRAAVVLAVAAPGTVAEAVGAGSSPEELDQLTGDLLDAVNGLELQHADVLAVVERRALAAADVAGLQDALEPLWNLGRYFSTANLLVAARAGPQVALAGADAVTVWSGATPTQLLDAGAHRVGVPVPVGGPVPTLPVGGFWATTIPAGVEVAAVKALVEATAR